MKKPNRNPAEHSGMSAGCVFPAEYKKLAASDMTLAASCINAIKMLS